jgi:hypothetical protein
MLRRIMAIGSAALLAFTVATTPLYAADLGMPTKAPIYKAPEAVEEFCWPCVLALLVAAGVGACEATCGCFRKCQECTSPPCN